MNINFKKMKSLKKLKFACFYLIVLFFLSSVYAQNQPYVILISFDGFRWDYLSRNLTPNIDNLIESGVKASSLQPVFPTKTFPNHISTITGLLPQNHGIIFNSFYDKFSDTYYSIGDTIQARNSTWYKGEAFWETAQRQGIITASYFWPGSDQDLDENNPDYFHHYDHHRPYEERVNGIIDWLQYPYSERPHFLTLYFDLTDGIGHRYGPISPEIDIAISSLDSTLGKLISGLEEIHMRDSVNIILVSDHGMTQVDYEKVINIEEILTGYQFISSNSGPVMMISAKESEIDNIYSLLKENENHFKVYYKKDIPEFYHFSKSPLVSEILLVAEMGWSVITNRNLEWMKPENYNGNHGYDNNHIDMHGIFVSSGPHFKKNYKSGTLNCLDIYPLLCEIFNIIPNNNIDGKLDRIGFILRETE